MENLENIELSLQINYYLLILTFLIAILYSYFVYKNTIPQISKKLKVFLIFVRTLIIALIVILIFEPILTFDYKEEIEPANLVFVDNSSSMVLQDSIIRSDKITDILSALEKNVEGEIELYSFGNKIDSVINPLKYNEPLTNFEEIFEFAANEKKEIASILIISDGIINDGSNSVNIPERAGIPFFTVGIGDTTIHSDIKIKKVLYNKLVYVDEPTEIRSIILNEYLAENNVSVSLFENSKLVDQQNVTLSSSGINNVSFTYTPNKPGQPALSIKVSKLDSEITFQNNSKSFIVDILESRINVLLISGSPSSDYSFIKQSLLKDEKLNISEIIQISESKFFNGDNYYNLIDSADILFLIGFPVRNTPKELLNSVTQAISSKHKPIFFLSSPTIDYQKLKSLEAFLPFIVKNFSNGFNQVQPQIIDNTNVLLSPKTFEVTEWNNLPPIYQTKSEIIPKPGSMVSANSKIRNITTGVPLILTFKLGRNKSIAVNGFDIWRWKLQSSQAASNLFDTFISNSIKLLNVDETKKQINIKPVKKVFSSAEQIEFTAEIYDETLTPQNNAEIKAIIQKGDENFEIAFHSIGDGLYEGIFETNLTGSFNYKGFVNFGNNFRSSTAGSFVITNVDIEKLRYRMNKDYLNLLATVSNGKYFDIDEPNNLFDYINQNYSKNIKSRVFKTEFKIWTSEWVLILIILLFSIEWFIRKRMGML